MSETPYLPPPVGVLPPGLSSMLLGVVESVDRETWRATVRDVVTAQRVPACRVLTPWMPVVTTPGAAALALYGFFGAREQDPFCIPVAASAFGADERAELEWCLRSDSVRLTVATDGKVELRQEATGVTIVVTADGVIQLAGATSPTQGAVQGEGIDPFTGATYAALNNASAAVLIKK